MQNTGESARLFARARARIAGGVNSPVRAFGGVGGEPLFMTRGEGAWVWDADGNRYADFVCSWGAQIVGHAHPAVTAAIQQAAAEGVGFGAPHARECEFAELLCEATPGLQQARAVCSGTEATMSAIRLARGHTRRDLIVKFAGCYHGHADMLLVAAGSGALTFGAPSSAGVPSAATQHTAALPYNDAQRAQDFFAKHGDKIAAVIVEPIAGNMNMLRPAGEFLQTLRRLCDERGAVLIFDEVMSGFRVARGGAQELFGMEADLICLGKVVGGGLNVAAFGGGKEIMQNLAPAGKVYQAGTLAGNPLALAAGLATLKLVLADGFFERLQAAGERLCKGLAAAAAKTGTAFCAQSAGGMAGLYARATPPQNFADMEESNAKFFRAFFWGMLERGVCLAPSMYEAAFIGGAHNEEVIDFAVEAAEGALAQAAEQTQ